MIIKRVYSQENTLEEVMRGFVNSKIEEVIAEIESVRYNNEENTIAPSQKEVH